MDSIETLLSEGLTELGLTAGAEQQDKLLAFTRLLAKWNKIYNLTAITRPADMVRLHLLDSLAVLPFITGQTVLDVGTGAGLPGIPLALLAPQIQFTLLDSNSKKTRFVQQAVIELGLKNVIVVQSRIEQYRPATGFDCILARAFASLPVIVAATRHLLNAGGTLLAQKGKAPLSDYPELDQVRLETLALNVPGIDAQRHLIAVKLGGSTL